MDVTHYNHEPIYVNLNNHSLTNPIPVEKLQAFIKKARETDFDVIKGEHRVRRYWRHCVAMSLARVNWAGCLCIKCHPILAFAVCTGLSGTSTGFLFRNTNV
ncbi:hypothetical protein DPMN_177126 [Dreissena polymorpha]|uniref:Uncharacterized protein n=1 Tax=Dreissena polymorpha TaxID=45954 RepID=A0A9D4EBK5_DREPO|nr:hypothetical protein DPMN_177126 [Dreissena polymorpha]